MRKTVCLLACALAAAPAWAGSLSIVSFDAKRGGAESLGNSGAAMLRHAIVTAFPGSTFHYAGALTARTLAGRNVAVLGAAYAGTQEITPLSAREQQALVAFVKAGGAALLFCDNDLQFQLASTSFAAPFGLSETGVLSDAQTATFAAGTNPIQTGPAGTASQFDTFWPGWFTSLGAATAVASLTANGAAEIAYLPAGTLAPGSGPVVLFGDSSALIDTIRTPNDTVAVLNALALAP